ncbi:MAG: outer membrane lipoprotein-sorting protein [endosymbiont of Escarpia spicata]|uniref:Outer membrane lipoprotein-sorting protein n=1 Tax=endosymbiont of Escarpia spicata TaxID=2200908 RepID=A0A370DTA2_9GAMM|nr:MAG: outer membrane lipoprotein-sorting protein [endosymbiont of Escarpia spicata]
MKRLLLIVLCSLLPLTGNAMTPEEQGLEIVREVDRRDTGFHDFKATMTMLLRNKHGEESLRHMRTNALEVENDGDKTLIIFDRPRDVKGTALLSYSHKTGSDDQWLYLPALKRVKRIASRNKSGPFMGSEFAYEDLSSQEVEKYTYKYIRDEQLNSKDVLVQERYPVDPNSGYTRQMVWVDKAEYIPLKIELYDRKKALLKTLEFKSYKQYLDRYWRASEMFMQNHQTGKSTLLTWEDYKFRTGLKSSNFGKNSLKRAR